MKRRIMIAIVVLIVCLLCGCSGAGKTNQGPSDTILEEALRSSLAEYAPQQELTDFEVETSLTQETSYTATVKALTKSRYAEFQNTISLSCTLYDQGWQADSCHWSMDSYNVVTYPTVDEMASIIQERNCYINFDEQQVCTDVSPQGERFTCRGVKTAKLPHADENTIYQSFWDYNPADDNWDLDSFNTISENVYYDLNGIWKSDYSPEISSIIISNFSSEGFDVSCTGYNTNTVHVTRQEGSNTFTGTGLNASFKLMSDTYTATNADVDVKLRPTPSGVEVILHFECDNGSMGCIESTLIG